MLEKCSICGASISDNNTTGIGYGCMANIVMPALKDWRYHAHGLGFWGKKCELLMELFTASFATRKFKNQFKASFTLSIIKQWDERKVMSRKQFDIVANMLTENHVQYSFEGIYKNWFEKLYPFSDDAFYTERLEGYKKQYLSGRKNKNLVES